MAFNFGEMTPEVREAALEKARTARLAKVASRAANRHLLKTEYADDAHWGELARKYGIARMPSSEEAVDTTTIRRMCTKLDIPLEVFAEHFTSVSYFVKHNPTWTKRAAAGVILELKDDLCVA